MATNYYFVPARNPVLNGYGFYKDRIRDDKHYWTCCCCKTHGCDILILINSFTQLKEIYSKDYQCTSRRNVLVKTRDLLSAD